VSRQVWNIFREGDSTASLGSLFQGSVTLRGKKFFLMILQNDGTCSALLNEYVLQRPECRRMYDIGSRVTKTKKRNKKEWFTKKF